MVNKKRAGIPFRETGTPSIQTGMHYNDNFKPQKKLRGKVGP